jgi:hypothetical protein
VRSKVEHAFHVTKWQFGFVMVRYRGLDKNAHRLFVTSALANLSMARRHLLRQGGCCVLIWPFDHRRAPKSASTPHENQVQPLPGHSRWWRSS